MTVFCCCGKHLIGEGFGCYVQHLRSLGWPRGVLHCEGPRAAASFHDGKSKMSRILYSLCSSFFPIDPCRIIFFPLRYSSCAACSLFPKRNCFQIASGGGCSQESLGGGEDLSRGRGRHGWHQGVGHQHVPPKVVGNLCRQSLGF